VPVISTNAGGLPEININGVTGYMTNVGDVKDMCDKAIEILKDPATHNQFKANALEQAKNLILILLCLCMRT